MRGEQIEPVAEQMKHRWDIIFSDAAGVEQDIDAGTELRRTAIRANDIVERGAWILAIGFVAIWMCAMVQEPLDGRRLDRFAGREDDREIAVPLRVYVGAVGDQKLHHRNAM